MSDCEGPYLATPSSPGSRARRQKQHAWGFPGLAAQAGGSAVSLPSRINWLSDNEECEQQDIGNRANKGNLRRGVKLKRRKAYYCRPKRDGRSKSLTQLDALGVGINDDMDSSSETENDQLDVPNSTRRRRRKLSSAGKVSGTEFFTAVFDVGGDEWEDLVPAVRGTCLREAISTVCERRGVDVESINVFLDNNKTPLPLLTSETSWLGGRTLKIRGKDESRSPVRGGGRGSITAPTSRKTSASYRGKQKFFNSLSVEEVGGGGSDGAAPATPSTDGSLKVNKGSKQPNRWSGLWGGSAKDQKMEGLVIQLDNYSRLGIPKLHHLSVFPDPAEDQVEEALYSLEDDWTEIVEGSSGLSERLKSQQTALWELISTELANIRTLKVIQDLFLNCLCNLQNSLILCEIDTEKLFCNIPEIYAANRSFWHHHVFPMLQEARESRQPLNPSLMRNGFTKVSEIFSPYYKYCAEQTACQQYCKDQDRDNQVFKAYLAWCETQRDCNRLRLIDILVRPMQRLTKYSLLLKAVLKKTDDINVKKDLVEMDKNVESLVRDVNSHMRQRQEQERLKNIIARIDSYEPIETKDDELQGLLATSSHLDLTCPMPGCAPGQRRNLLMEGDLKMREGSSSKIDVHCFLFTDMLLICKIISKKGERVKVIRQPYIVDRLVTVDVTKDSSTCLACVYLNEYKIAVAAFTLHGSENKLVRSWKDSLEKANNLYQEAKMATVCSLENILFTNYDEEEEEFSGGSYLHAPISRRGSRRSSRYSSIAHSHSGSMDLNDASVASGKRDVSLELSDGRGSSFSSEDSCAPIISKPRAASLDNRLLDTAVGQASYPSSPRNERKLAPHKLSPNTLSVEITPTTPDETDRDTSSHGPARVHSPLSPIRGISYPPLSPKSLKRGFAIQQQTSRNPPLIKSRQLAASAEIAPGRQITGETLGPNITVIADHHPDTETDTEHEQKQKRGGRFDRPDNRRYHTAGTIEDLKKIDNKDSSIHKRLSWNQQPTIPGNDLQLKTKQSKCLSTDSVQSSSGVSSNGSLHLSIGSEFEPLPQGPAPSTALSGSSVVTIGGLSVPASPLPTRTQPTNTPPIPPRGNHHISTTYITQDTVIVRQLTPSSSATTNRTHQTVESHVKNSAKIFHSKSEGVLQSHSKPTDTGAQQPVEKPYYGTIERGARKANEPTNPEITINLAEAKETISPININISNQKSPNSEILKLREILLSDSSVEASNV